jgi:NADPH-dependent curcumin reductase CurA
VRRHLNNPADVRGPKNYLSLLINSARMEGFIVFNYRERYSKGIQALATWMAQGKLKAREKISSKDLKTSRKRFSSYFAGRTSESWSSKSPRSEPQRGTAF